MTTKMYTTAELADVLRENERTSRNRCYRGEIDFIDVGTDLRPRLRITQEALDAYLDRLAQKRRPKS